jgi:ribosomal protein L37E
MNIPDFPPDEMVAELGSTEVQTMEPKHAGRRTELVAIDRCDRCGAQAVVMTMHTCSVIPFTESRDLELLWCAHHATKLGPALLMNGAEIVIDNRGALVASETGVHNQA